MSLSQLSLDIVSLLSLIFVFGFCIVIVSVDVGQVARSV